MPISKGFAAIKLLLELIKIGWGFEWRSATKSWGDEIAQTNLNGYGLGHAISSSFAICPQKSHIHNVNKTQDNEKKHFKNNNSQQVFSIQKEHKWILSKMLDKMFLLIIILEFYYSWSRANHFRYLKKKSNLHGRKKRKKRKKNLIYART